MSLDLNLIYSDFNFTMDKSSRHKIYEFEKFRLDTAHLMLYRGAEEISLVPKAVETLLVLVERRGEIVHKDELMETIWTDSIVEESNLAKYLHVLRKTLGNQQNGKPFIETYRRRGYRFNGEVKVGEILPEAKSEKTNQNFAPLHTPTNGSAIKEATTGRVVALADWRNASEEKEKSPQTNLSDAQGKEFPVAGRKRNFVVGASVFGLLILVFSFFAFNQLFSEKSLKDASIKTIAFLDEL